ncbi:outer membrane lipoprotein LolB [Exilibacterium tricleocarpae]|uniref:Outer-membrane lipoprotein LolB n=1 Tax=Exilibacterium tricleocarpae TaxID=2591008 RepID=A0A545U5P2_9GAMM|nr:lipoprotein insertase outer membrane protein LolB [Exilibacterium tricleocarpae]TQV84795.1 outer membrane lipoprotein LolB [Exilibacterium tricleocarpae]
MTFTGLCRRSLWLVLAALLGGCAGQPKLPPIDNWDAYQQQLAQLHNWQLRGKLGVRMPADSGSVTLDWEQEASLYAIRLSGPFGQGTTWIRGNRRQVQLEQAGQPPLSAGTPEELIQSALGWDIPVRDLYYWVRGIPAPRAPVASQEKTANGALAYLEQSGWQLSYSRYNTVGPWQLPGKIVAIRDPLKLTLVIRQWEVGDR